MYYLLLIPLLLVGYKTSLKFKILVKTLCIICRMVLIKCLYYLDPRVRKLEKNKFEISYVIGSKLYKFQTKIKRGPATVLQVVDKDYNDITKLIKPYLGPNRDFHNITYLKKDSISLRNSPNLLQEFTKFATRVRR